MPYGIILGVRCSMITDSGVCTGCRACAEICPKGCIVMKPDNEGFLYPYINEHVCVECGLCRRICPQNNDKVENTYKQTLFAFVHKDKNVFMNSSSGGAFSAIAESIYDKYEKVAVFGAAMNENLECEYDVALTYEDTKKFRKSKYIPANTNDCYSKCKKYLESGYMCVFTGTPCIIAGIYAYLGQPYDNLLTIDILCRGVPNNDIWKRYRNEIEKKYDAKIKSFTFRYKQNRKYGDKILLSSENILIGTDNGEIPVNRHDDAFLIGYHDGLFYRKSCYRCRYACRQRISDITISDFWNYELIHKETDFCGKSGISAIIINSNKAEKILDKINIKKCANLWQKENINDLANNNLPLVHPTMMNKKRKKFFCLLNKIGFENSIKCVYKENILYVGLKRLYRFVRKPK